MDSLPFNEENVSLALQPRLRDFVVNRFLHTAQTQPGPKRGPRGQFFNAAGDPIPPPMSLNAEPSNRGNAYGLLLNAYGERGNRLTWLSYTNGLRQMH